MWKRLSQRVLLIVFGILIATLVIELGARFTGLFYDPPTWWMDLQTRIHSIYRPGSTYMQQTEEFQSIRISNSEGLVDSERNLEKPPNTYRMLMLGDSFVAGEQLPLGKTFSGLLENDPDLLTHLKAEKAVVEVINAGISGTGTGEQYIYYMERGYKFQADMVVLNFFLGNDIINNSLELNALNTVNLKRSHFTIDESSGNLVEVPGIGRNLEQTLYLRSFVWRIIGGFMRSRLGQIDTIEPTVKQVTAWNNMYVNDLDHPELERAYEVTGRLIDALRDAAQGDGATFKVILIPSKQQVMYDVKDLQDNINPLLPNEKLQRILDAGDYLYFDLTMILRERWLKSSQSYYYVNDIHLNENGHRFIACTISLFLQQIESTVTQCENTIPE